jgi:hypothetical protein
VQQKAKSAIKMHINIYSFDEVPPISDSGSNRVGVRP